MIDDIIEYIESKITTLNTNNDSNLNKNVKSVYGKNVDDLIMDTPTTNTITISYVGSEYQMIYENAGLDELRHTFIICVGSNKAFNITKELIEMLNNPFEINDNNYKPYVMAKFAPLPSNDNNKLILFFEVSFGEI